MDTNAKTESIGREIILTDKIVKTIIWIFLKISFEDLKYFAAFPCTADFFRLID